MATERWQQIEELYHAALEHAPERRAAFLAEACADDADLRREVEELLRYDGEAETFMQDNAAVAVAHQLDSEELEDTQTLLNGQQLGAYKILAPLGKGGMGEVHLAFDTRLERKVALKLLPRDVATNKERLHRFVREAKAASALNHPHVATVYDIGAADGVSFIAMEYVEGQTLAAKINGAPMPINEVIAIGCQIADALDEAHTKGITHRDLKPANVMLTAREQVKVLDFGLAKIARPPSINSNISTLAKTASGVVMGTVPYMSPEQALGREVDHRSDIFSLGVVLYEMATGRLPFAGANTVETLDRILHAEPEAIAQFNSDAPAELERIVQKCLAKEREQRYQAARELLVDLKNLQRESDAGVSVKTANLSSTLNRFPHRALWLVGILLLIGAGPAYWLLKPSDLPKVSGYQQLTNDGLAKTSHVTNFNYALATDGPRVYFTELREGRITLAQVAATGGGATLLPMPFPNTTLLDIAPTSSELLLGGPDGLGRPSPFWMTTALGGAQRRLGDVTGHLATWSPDGRQIAYSQARDLYLVTNGGADARKLLSLPQPVTHIRWSPDGSRLRFTLGLTGLLSHGPPPALWEVNVDGSNLHALLPDWSNVPVCCGTWTPDGKYYVFQATRDQSTQIWALREAGGFFASTRRVPVQLTSGPMNFLYPVPSRDGGKIFVIGRHERGELVRYDTTAQQYVPYLPGLSAEQLSYSPDRAWVAYVTYPEGDLWRSKVDGTERLQLSAEPLKAALPHWSPDGKQIVFCGQLPGKPLKLYLASSDGGTPQQLIPGDRAETNPNWSPGGNALVFGNAIGMGGVRLLDLRTNQESLLPGSDSVFYPRWSPDGRYVAAASPQGLVLYDFTTQQWTNIAHVTAQWHLWSRDGQYLYFSTPFQKSSAMMRLRIADRKLESLASLKAIRLASSLLGMWTGVTADDAPLVLRDAGTQEIYALEWKAP